MPPKVNLDDPEVARIIDLFSKISYTGPKAQETTRNAKHVAAIESVITRNNLAEQNLDAKLGSNVVFGATQGTALPEEKRDYLVKKIVKGDLDNDDRIKTAIKFLGSVKGDTVEEAAFDKECGVGVVVTKEQVEQIVTAYVSDHKTDLEAKGRPNIGTTLGSLRSVPELRWANNLDIKNAADAQLNSVWPKTADAGPSKAAKTPAAAKKEARPKADSAAELDPDAMFKEGFLSKLHAPGENPQVDPSLKQWHLDATKGRVFTRFPPEPNGFLHIGHTKAIAIDFGFARYHNGLCYLRFDDTNPEAEEGVYFNSILETVRWLGFEPWKITYSSDYFQQLYELAVVMIKKGRAYVDHSTPEEIFEERGGKDRGARKPSRFRDRPIEENLKEFQDMKDGKYKKGSVTLRMKQDIVGSGNPQMWDLIAYRVLDTPHHRTGDTWKIYPTYDFTHCLVDSFENISHSLCTTEFILSRESYEWLCDAVDVYKPRQYEFGRLNLEGTITSKRKIKALVEGKYVKDWDDPRLFTVIAIRRRGVPPGAILSFVNQLGVSTSVSQIPTSRFDQSVRQYLESSTPRLMMVLNPIKVVLENVAEDFFVEIEKPLHPKVPSLGKNKVPLTKTLYIDGSDFRTQDDPDYFRLAPGKTVGLFQAPFPITHVSHEIDESTGQVTLIRARYEDPELNGGKKLEKAQLKKVAYIQWVGEHAASQSPVVVDEARLFHPLFTVDNPSGESNFLDHINPNSLETHSNALIEVGLWDVCKNALSQSRNEAIKRAEDVKSLRTKLSSDGGDVIRPPKTVAELKETGQGAPETTVDQLLGLENVRFQAMRIGYFALDRETEYSLEELEKGAVVGSEKKKLILNRTVTLKSGE
ncbi:unnamed protein product [Sympodiomycopsis kandeliae]